MSRLRPALAQTVGGLPRAFWWLWLGTLVNRMGSFVIPFLAFYLTGQLQFSVAFTGVVLSIYGGGSALAAVVGGILADRIGRRPTLLGSHLATCGALVGLGFAREPVAIAIMTGVLGFASNAARPAYQAMMADIVPAKDRIRAFSLNYWAINMGFAVAPVIAGLMASHSYLLLFVGDAIATLLTALVVFWRVPESMPIRSAEHRRAEGGMGTVLKDSSFMAFVGLAFLIAAIFGQINVTLPVIMQEDGLSPATYGAVMALNGVLIVLLQLPATRYLSKYRRRSRVLAVAAVLIGIGLGLNAFASSAPFYALTLVVWTVGEILNAPAGNAVTADLSPVALRGRYQGIFTLAWATAGFVSPALGGAVLEHFGRGALWCGCFAVGLLAAGGHLAIAPARARRLAALRAADAAPLAAPVA